MSQDFTNWDRARAGARSDAAKRNLKKARNSGDPEAIAKATSDAGRANRAKRRTRQQGPGRDAAGGGPIGASDG